MPYWSADMQVKPYTESNYRWYILFLATVTNAVTIAIPSMSMSVLFEEISGDLGLTLTQVGIIWGIGSLPGIVTLLLGGAIGDRFGAKRVLTVVCLLAGLSGALRGLSDSFLMLAITTFLFGFLTPMVPMNATKSNRDWFSRKQLGLANGVVSMGMAAGFMLGALLSATVISPWLGGWRHTLIFYGLLATVLTIPWYLARSAPQAVDSAGRVPGPTPIRDAIAHVSHLRNLWWLGWAIMGVGGGIQGVLGYLPLYLRNQGWAEANADGALSMFHLLSLIFVIPIALGSDKLGARRMILIASTLFIVVGFGLLSVVEGTLVLVAVGMAGMVRDGFMAVFITMIMESDGVGTAYAGTAAGFVMLFSGFGTLLAPPIGNALADLSPGLPFLFWSALVLVGIVGLVAASEGRDNRELKAQPAGA